MSFKYLCFLSRLESLDKIPIILTGGEDVKNNYQNVERVYQAIHEGKICRHSYVLGRFTTRQIIFLYSNF